MTPIHFGDSFGWLHLPPPIEIASSGKAAGKPRSRAVVLCASVGREATALHRPWLLLAEQIAAAGMPVLRFDYPGTGDSARDEGDPVSLTDWVGSIVAAAAWVKEQTDATEVALCGIRAGAALALAAAPAIEGLSRLALLAPAASWSRFFREQELMAGVSDRMWMVQHPTERVGQSVGRSLATSWHGDRAGSLPGACRTDA
jgi:alpha-beta hydrolase superfamily lysophospholipase